MDFATRNRDPVGFRLLTHIHHSGAAVFIEMS
jgi:hypothetical protein